MTKGITDEKAKAAQSDRVVEAALVEIRVPAHAPEDGKPWDGERGMIEADAMVRWVTRRDGFV